MFDASFDVSNEEQAELSVIHQCNLQSLCQFCIF